LAIICRPAPPELHGAARFATTRDIQAAGLMGKTGLVVGKHRGKFLLFPGQQFCLVAAPTRSGKGVSFVIPNLLHWPHSCVVLDIKLENFHLTSRFRASHGQKVFLFAPFAEDGRTHRWNPLDGISRHPNRRVGDLLTLGGTLFPVNPNDKDAFWHDSARNLFIGLALFVMETPGLPATLGEILRQSGGQGQGLKASLAKSLKDRAQAGTPYSPDCVAALNRFMNAAENTLANILSTFSAPLTLFANPLIDAATSASDFDISRVRDERMTVYIGVPPNRLSDAALLINLLFSQLINLNTRELPGPGRHPIPCLLILDEFTAIGKIGILARSNAFISGYNLRLLTIIQSVAQLESVYGANDARTLVTNHAMQVVFAPREQRDANAYSEMLGSYTLKNTARGQSFNRGFGASGSRSETVSDQRRALMLPQELKTLPATQQIILMEQAPPIRCERTRYFAEPRFIDRLKAQSATLAAIKGLPSQRQLDVAALPSGELSIAVPALDISAHVARVERRLRPLRADEAIQVACLEIDPSVVPPLPPGGLQTVAETGVFVDDYFQNMGVDIDAVALTLDDRGSGLKTPPASQPGGLATTSQLTLEA
ncbi:MAG TPA: type IV secretory system conjugative DNA transfer family protein, partial [Asticcacaulis sp.]|nr:type IV secretory system conjugative DNA transfer family protein [Asticcacaulis sp.]